MCSRQVVSKALIPVPPRAIQMIEGIFSAVWRTSVWGENNAALVNDSTVIGDETKFLAELRELPHVEEPDPAAFFICRRQRVDESIGTQVQPGSEKHLRTAECEPEN